MRAEELRGNDGHMNFGGTNDHYRVAQARVFLALLVKVKGSREVMRTRWAHIVALAS